MRMGDRWKTSSMRVPRADPLTTRRLQPSDRCRSSSDGCSPERRLTSVIAAGQANQNPVNPCGLLYGILTLVTSLSEPSGCVA